MTSKNSGQDGGWSFSLKSPWWSSQGSYRQAVCSIGQQHLERNWYLKGMPIILLGERSQMSISSKHLGRRDKFFKLIRTPATIIFIEQRETYNISSMKKRLQLVINEPTQSTLHSIQTGKRGFGWAGPNVTAVLHIRTDLALVEIVNSSRCEEFPCSKKPIIFPTSLAKIEYKSSIWDPGLTSTQVSFKAFSLWKSGFIHHNRGKRSGVSLWWWKERSLVFEELKG